MKSNTFSARTWNYSLHHMNPVSRHMLQKQKKIAYIAVYLAEKITTTQISITDRNIPGRRLG